MASLEDLNDAQKAQALALFNFVQGDPETAKLIRGRARVKNPAMPKTDAEELEERFSKENGELRAALEERNKADEKREMERRREAAHAKCREAGFEPDAVEKLMTDNSIGNYDTAIKFMRQQSQLAPATPESITPMSLPDSKEMWGDPKKAARNAAFQAINEIKAGRTGTGR